jgi:protein-disulfide isomerase
VRAVLLIACWLVASACSPSHLLPGSSTSTPAPQKAQAIRVASSNLITKPGTSEPKVVLSLYEDFLCPVCGSFEQTYGPTVTQLIDSGQVAADYYPVAILDSPQRQNYSSRAGGAAYCVADADTSPDKAAFRRFHAVLFAQQPSETGSAFPTDAALADAARQAGVVAASDCINAGRNTELSAGQAKASNINATPTVRINGADYDFTTPDALTAKVKELLG